MAKKEDFLLGDFEVAPGSRTGLQISLLGSAAYPATRYVPILRRAFPSPARWFGTYESFNRKFSHVVYVQDQSEGPLRTFLEFAKERLLIPSSLDECWALDIHWQEGFLLKIGELILRRDPGRTEIGELVYRAKTYTNKPGDPATADELARVMSDAARQHPAIARADLIIGVPANPPKQPHNLPELLAANVGKALGLATSSDVLKKVRPTSQVKNLSADEKLKAIEGAFAVREDLSGRTIVLVDDLFQSGATLAHIADQLRQAGASRIIGLVGTKTKGDDGAS